MLFYGEIFEVPILLGRTLHMMDVHRRKGFLSKLKRVSKPI